MKVIEAIKVATSTAKNKDVKVASAMKIATSKYKPKVMKAIKAMRATSTTTKEKDMPTTAQKWVLADSTTSVTGPTVWSKSWFCAANGWTLQALRWGEGKVTEVWGRDGSQLWSRALCEESAE